MNRVYTYRDRGRLVLILRGKRVGLSLSEIGEILGCSEGNARVMCHRARRAHR